MPSPWEIQLAKHFKDRNNVEQIGVTLGDVISVNPLSIAIYNDKVILTEQQCYVCSSLKTKNTNITLDNVADHGTINTTCTIENILNAGDKVLCLPTVDGQTFFIVDKVVI